MRYQNFDKWDFVEDEYFVDWVLRPVEHSEKFWNSFLAENPEKRVVIMQAREIVAQMKYARDPKLEDREYVDLFEKILKTKKDFHHSDSKIIALNSKSTYYLKYAAGITIILITVIVFKINHQQTQEITSPVRLVTKKCPKGSQLTAVLSDGTKVRLQGGSSLTYPEVFDDSLRSVFLSGEAFFEVEKDPLKPFKVKSNWVTTEVLGTSFNVQAYPNDNIVSVAVAEGKVNVTSNENTNLQFQHTLEINQESELDIGKRQAIKRELYDDSKFAWTRWQLVFKKHTLQQIFQKLERWYGISIVIEGKIGMEETFSGSFDNDPINVVLEALKSQGAFDYNVSGKQVNILPIK